MENMPRCPAHIPMRPAPGRAGRRGLVLVCALAFSVLCPGAAATADEAAWGAVATPLRIVNLNPFQLLYGVPGSLGARVMAPGSSEVIASMDMASHLVEASSGAERVLIDGETHRQGLALRHGFGDGWEYLFEGSALSHRAGRLDGFIETWHDVFHLPQGDRDRAPRDRLALFYANGGRTYYDIGRSVSSLGDISLGVGYAVPHWPLSNDGLAIRGSVKLPTGDESLRWRAPAGIRPRSGRRPRARCQDRPTRGAGYTARAWERLPERRPADFRTLAATFLPSDTLA